MSFGIFRDYKYSLFFKSFQLAALAITATLLCYQGLYGSDKLCVASYDSTSNIIYSEIPEGIEIKRTDYGYGVFASKDFKNKEIIYKNQYIDVPDVEQHYLLKTAQGDFLLNSTTHAVAMGNGTRALYTFDSMMNHSCEANSYSENGTEFEGKNVFLQIACRDIKAGEEITCNYLFFEYDCADKAITQCCCHSDHCLHEIRGFKWLPFSKQVELIPSIDKTILEQFLADYKDIIYIENLKTPESIGIEGDKNNFRLVAKRSFKKGEVVYQNTTLYFEQEKHILVSLGDSVLPIVNGIHTVNRGNGMREFFYFDSFMNHSCDPNTITLYTSPGKYQGIALKDINPGDELTCDYTVFDDQADESEGFECHCGAPNCRKFIL